MPAKFNSENVINGTFGECWLGTSQLGETKKLKANLKKKTAEITKPRQLVAGSKTIAVTLEGSITLYHVDSSVAQEMINSINSGKEVRHTIISKLDDPNGLGAERIALYGVNFTDMNIVDWEHAKEGEKELSFSFESCEFLDAI